MVQRWLSLSFLLLFGALSWSQDSPSRFQVFGGYSYVPSNFSYLGGGESGWNAAVDVHSWKWLSITGDFGQYFATYSYGGNVPSDHSTTYTFLFGPRISAPLSRTSRITPFGHFLIGGAHISQTGNGFSTDKSFAWAFGGGLDYRLTDHLSLRGEGDYLHNNPFVTQDNQLQNRVPARHARLSTGVVFRF